MTFKEKVQSMSGKEIVQTMIDGLNREWVVVRMLSFGHTDGKVCYGCAATNTICQLIGRPFNKKMIGETLTRARSIRVGDNFLATFENAIDDLRSGRIASYNRSAIKIGMATLPIPENPLPEMWSCTYKDNLIYYQEFADSL